MLLLLLLLLLQMLVLLVLLTLLTLLMLLLLLLPPADIQEEQTLHVSLFLVCSLNPTVNQPSGRGRTAP